MLKFPKKKKRKTKILLLLFCWLCASCSSNLSSLCWLFLFFLILSHLYCLLHSLHETCAPVSENLFEGNKKREPKSTFWLHINTQCTTQHEAGPLLSFHQHSLSLKKFLLFFPSLFFIFFFFNFQLRVSFQFIAFGSCVYYSSKFENRSFSFRWSHFFHSLIFIPSNFHLLELFFISRGHWRTFRLKVQFL